MSLEMKVDLSFNDLDMLFKEYEEIAIRYMWAEGREPTGSRKIWNEVCAEMSAKYPWGKWKDKQPISRASVIFAANRNVDAGIWDYRTATGKGGHHRRYFAIMTEEELWKALKKTANKKFDKLLEAGA